MLPAPVLPLDPGRAALLQRLQRVRSAKEIRRRVSHLPTPGQAVLQRRALAKQDCCPALTPLSIASPCQVATLFPIDQDTPSPPRCARAAPHRTPQPYLIFITPSANSGWIQCRGCRNKFDADVVTTTSDFDPECKRICGRLTTIAATEGPESVKWLRGQLSDSKTAYPLLQEYVRLTGGRKRSRGEISKFSVHEYKESVSAATIIQGKDKGIMMWRGYRGREITLT